MACLRDSLAYFRYKRSPSPVSDGISSARNVRSGSHPESDAYPGYPPPQTNRDILNVIHPKSQVDCNLNDLCNELRHSPEAEHARVTSILRYATGGRTTHRFLILHAVKKSGENFFIRLDRHPRTQDLFKVSCQSYLAANDHVRLLIFAILDGTLTASMLRPGKVGALEGAATGQAKVPRRSRPQF